MDWKDMSEAERRRWALEQANLAARLTYGETKQSAFAVAEAMLEFIGGRTASVQAPTEAGACPHRSSDTRDQQLCEAT